MNTWYAAFGTTLIYLACLASLARASTLSITSQAAYTSVRPCVQHCIFCGEYWLANCFGMQPGLNNILSCNNLDSLFCRTDLTPSASSYLTTCIYSLCSTNTVDLSDGLHLYNGYCGFGGATLDNFPITSQASSTSELTEASTTSDTETSHTVDKTQESSASTSRGSSTFPRVTGETTSSSDADNSDKGQDGDRTVTVVCSILGVIFAFGALFVGRKWWIRRRRQLEWAATP